MSLLTWLYRSKVEFTKLAVISTISFLKPKDFKHPFTIYPNIDYITVSFVLGILNKDKCLVNL